MTNILHIALHCPDEKKANIFFGKVLGLREEKQFILSSGFSKQLFGIEKEIRVKLFSNDDVCFEIFITKIKPKKTYEHICLAVDDKKDLIFRCKKYRIQTDIKKRDKKEYLFIKDYAGYLYEIKTL